MNYNYKIIDNKPLTLDELKILKTNDYVYLVKHNYVGYCRVTSEVLRNNMLSLDPIKNEIGETDNTAIYCISLEKEDNKDQPWKVYRNKEHANLAESEYLIDIKAPFKIGDAIYLKNKALPYGTISGIAIIENELIFYYSQKYQMQFSGFPATEICKKGKFTLNDIGKLVFPVSEGTKIENKNK